MPRVAQCKHREDKYGSSCLEKAAISSMCVEQIFEGAYRHTSVDLLSRAHKKHKGQMEELPVRNRANPIRRLTDIDCGGSSWRNLVVFRSGPPGSNCSDGLVL